MDQAFSSTVDSVRQRVDGTYPVGEALLALRSGPNSALFLAPLAKPFEKGKGKKGKPKGKGKGGSSPMPNW